MSSYVSMNASNIYRTEQRIGGMWDTIPGLRLFYFCNNLANLISVNALIVPSHF